MPLTVKFLVIVARLPPLNKHHRMRWCSYRAATRPPGARGVDVGNVYLNQLQVPLLRTSLVISMHSLAQKHKHVTIALNETKEYETPTKKQFGRSIRLVRVNRHVGRLCPVKLWRH